MCFDFLDQKMGMFWLSRLSRRKKIQNFLWKPEEQGFCLSSKPWNYQEEALLEETHQWEAP